MANQNTPLALSQRLMRSAHKRSRNKNRIVHKIKNRIPFYSKGMTSIFALILVLQLVAPALQIRTLHAAAPGDQTITNGQVQPPDPDTSEPSDPANTPDTDNSQPIVQNKLLVPLFSPTVGDWAPQNADGSYTTADNVTLNHTYTAPQNDKVHITFTLLPDRPGTLTIKEIKLTTDQQIALNTFSDTAYDITSTMPNGTFKYNLTLPNPNLLPEVQNDQTKTVVLYSSDTTNFSGAQAVSQDTQNNGDTETVTGLDHFTAFMTSVITTSDFNLSSSCSSDPATYRNWTIESTIGTSANLSWKLYSLSGSTFVDTGDTGNLTLAANETLNFDTPAASGISVLLVYRNGNILVNAEFGSTEHCTIPPQPCGHELVADGGFETPAVTNSAGWDVFTSGSTPWHVIWTDPSTATNKPVEGNLELQKGVNGWNPEEGKQYAELDSDWQGPSNPGLGGASSQIYQYLPTVAGATYVVSFWTSARPETAAADNTIKVDFGSNTATTTPQDGASLTQTDWVQHTYSWTATSAVTKLSFTDMGISNSTGSFLDNVSVIQNCAATVTLCKVDQNHTPVKGWSLFLGADQTSEVTVKPDGTEYTAMNIPAGDYVVVADGAYHYRDTAGATDSDAAFSERAPGDGFTGGAYDPWYLENDFPGLIQGFLGIEMNDQITNWGAAYNPAHLYATSLHMPADGSVNFRILDDNYGDNTGSIDVRILKGFQGFTGADGCVTFHNVPYGDYVVQEVPQQGWTYTSGIPPHNGAITIDHDQTVTIVNHNDTVTPPHTPSATILASKVVCDSESDLPNWGDGHGSNGNPGQITATTAQDYVTASDGKCHLQTDWNFQWGNQNVSVLPGNFVGPATNTGSGVNDWHNFSTSTLLSGSTYTPAEADVADPATLSKIWVREVLLAGYIPFSAPESGYPGNNVSAEMYCNNDVLNYDNYDFIANPVANTTYYCVAFNAQAAVVHPPVNTVSGTKFEDLNGNGKQDTGENGITDWNIYLTQKADTFNVAASDTTPSQSNITLDNAQKYLVEVTGTFDAGDGIQADAKYSFRTPTSTTWTDSVSTYESAGPELLDLQYKDDSSVGAETTPAYNDYNANHNYWFSVTGTGNKLDFHVNDTFPSNNAGNLTVNIFKIVDSTITDGSGNYTFNLPNTAGDYQVIEGMPTGWIQTLPGSSAYYTVTAGTDYTAQDFGNQSDVTPITPTPVVIHGIKYNDVNSNGINDSEAGISGVNIVAINPVPVVSTFDVDSASAVETPTASLPIGNYLIQVTGTDKISDNGPWLADAQYTSQDGFNTYSNGTPSGSYAGAGIGEGNLEINDGFIDYGPYSSAHSYLHQYDQTVAGPVDFRVFDGDVADPTTVNPSWYADNSGLLHVTIYQILGTAVTASDGTYSITLPTGTTNVGLYEMAQSGWTQTGPTDPTAYNDINLGTTAITSFDIGNHQNGTVNGTTTDGGSPCTTVCSTSGGGGGPYIPPIPAPQVAGAFTMAPGTGLQMPSNPGQVLGASTLPRTGLPLGDFVATLAAFLGLALLGVNINRKVAKYLK